MLKKTILWGLLAMLILLPVGQSLAQDENSAPLYVRYCTQTRQNQGENALQSAINDIEDYLLNVEAFLRRVNSGNLTFIEAVSESEAILVEWDSAAARSIPCLAPLERDVTVMLQELLVSMLYGLNLKTDDSSRYLANVQSSIERINTGSDAALSFLAQPLPTPEPIVLEEVVEEEPVERTPETLSAEMSAYLLQNKISVLREGLVQEFPEGYVITLVLDRFVLNGVDYDYDNTLFTLDTLAGLILDWEELDLLQRIRVETYDGDSLTLTVGLLGANFRAHFAEQTLNRDAFLASLEVQEITLEGEAPAPPSP